MSETLALVLLGVASLTAPPPLSDLERFAADYEYARECVAVADRHECFLNEQLWATWEESSAADWREEARYDRYVWVLLREALEIGRGEDARRESLRLLRHHLRPHWYDRGVMPQPVPWRRFRIID